MAKSRRDKKGRTFRKGESYRKKQGLYVYAFTDALGKRRFIYAKDLGTLREKEDDLKRDQLDGLDLYVAGVADLNYVFDRYMSLKTGIRKTTRSTYMYNYNTYVRDGFGTRKIAELKYSDVLQFYEYLIEEEDLAVSTVEGVHTILHPTFEMAVRDDIIRKNPSNGVLAEVKKICSSSKGKRFALTVEQQRAFVDYLEDPRNIRWHPIFVVMLGTGLRIGEVIGLRWIDIDFEGKKIDINHTVTYYSDREGSRNSRFIVSKPKTAAGNRSIPMLEPVRKAFLEEKELQEKLGVQNNQEIDGMSGFVFCNRYGNVHIPSSVNRMIKRIVDDYNAEEILQAKRDKREPVLIPRFTNHCLRHTFCTRLCEEETNLKVIQNVMGHADISTTMNIYAEVSEQKKQESFEDLSNKWDLF